MRFPETVHIGSLPSGEKDQPDGFGNGQVLQSPADRVKDVHLAGAVLDLYESDKIFVQALIAVLGLVRGLRNPETLRQSQHRIGRRVHSG